jgi:hypothetical protein
MEGLGRRNEAFLTGAGEDFMKLDRALWTWKVGRHQARVENVGSAVPGGRFPRPAWT